MDTRLRMVVAAAVAGASAFAMSGSRLVAQDAPAELTGCHDLIVGQWVVETHADWEDPSPLDSDRWYRIPRIRFAGPHDRRPTATRMVAAGGESLEALGYEDRFATGEIQGDSLRLGFSDGYTGMTVTMGRAGEGWTGTVRTFTDIVPHQVNDRPVAMSRVGCESPLPVPGDDSRPLGRVVELEGGQVITLGEPLPERLETAALPRFGWFQREDGTEETTPRSAVGVVGRTRGLLGATDVIQVYTNLDGTVHSVRLLYGDPGAMEALEERLRNRYGAPRTRSGVAGVLIYHGPSTTLWLRPSAPAQAEVLLTHRRW